ncbi:ribonuclease E activity regulator RraA [Sulfoacidibacillus thermotolerans]|uniref:4-hydroxy-4-methyl-2-oxoglutarate aldolase n=1 Tax=Sulfoacidibacillus thermotolerans TaxID=1765684 RepID=A0A2U3DC49_SULT2|nr:ribonuclease E activity regulator RraA [Sulfoacidibacillus thermotolerans]PWI58867.1 S-adenosylmethionine--2-demethylmenaquinone methyltransferase [Sulfoacidibacillus thermotolerans]
MHTADLCDLYGSKVRLCKLKFISYGKNKVFSGPIHTVRVYEDNVLVKDAISSIPTGAVLVIDGGGSRECALVGGNLAALAEKRGLSGMIVYGCVRDVHELQNCQLGILALGACPVKSRKEGTGSRDVTVSFGDLSWEPGNYVFADEDGVVISAENLLDQSAK